MSSIVIDTHLRDKLMAAGSTVELRDESGQLIGRFISEEALPWDRSIGMDEMIRRADSTGPKYTTAQVMEHLRKLA